jgi:hypothetical protein
MIVTTADFVALLAKKYPSLPPKEINKICLLLMRRLYGYSVHDQDVRVASGHHGLSLKIYKPDQSPQAHNARVDRQARDTRWRRLQARRTRTS